MSPSGMVTRKDSQSVDCAATFCFRQPPQDPPDRQGEQRGVVAVGRWPAVAPFVDTGRAFAAQVVPGRGLVAAERPEPDGVAHEDQAAGPGDAQHLVQHPPRVRHVFEDVRGEADVDRAVADRQRQSVAAHRADRPDVDRRVAGAGLLESLGEEARAAADIQHTLPGERAEPPHQRHRIGGQRQVERGRVGLFPQAGSYQGHRAPHGEEAPVELFAQVCAVRAHAHRSTLSRPVRWRTATRRFAAVRQCRHPTR